MLIALGVQYEKQKFLVRYAVDFYLPDENLVIEVNGCYWHRCQVCGYDDPRCARQREYERIQVLESHGYQVVVFWEHDLIVNRQTKA